MTSSTSPSSSRTLRRWRKAGSGPSWRPTRRSSGVVIDLRAPTKSACRSGGGSPPFARGHGYSWRTAWPCCRSMSHGRGDRRSVYREEPVVHVAENHRREIPVAVLATVAVVRRWRYGDRTRPRQAEISTISRACNDHAGLAPVGDPACSQLVPLVTESRGSGAAAGRFTRAPKRVRSSILSATRTSSSPPHDAATRGGVAA
jgi:hypothetical protein